ncbi:uncharacterized protein F4822DRAFT_356346 [Hypoxylon trugodes]|uniref:uncharacterized protein n=1 Tax=Hypoxylon trugodes TaxID=326681 RepID=UPI00219383FA|nr:uncharacterized protein F4822DRAFT_356346 [Hypoxylon trugodes]KAI1385863.1 hypothetical protein F4822DRAFT_356346 [Hypoxylon trugodes]
MGRLDRRLDEINEKLEELVAFQSETSGTSRSGFTPATSETMGDNFRDNYSYTSECKTATMLMRETVPWPGQTYIIREPSTRMQITLIDGELRLEDHKGDQGGYHWKCIETNGWLGFYNPSDMLHIGHDNRGNFIARAQQHDSWEYFGTRAHPDGGYLLLMRHGNTLWKMTIGEDGRKLVETNEKEKGTAWEFVKV